MTAHCARQCSGLILSNPRADLPNWSARVRHPDRSGNRLLAFVLLASLAMAHGLSLAADSPALLVFGAASLTNVLDDLGMAFTVQTHVPVKTSYASSSVLARQI